MTEGAERPKSLRCVPRPRGERKCSPMSSSVSESSAGGCVAGGGSASFRSYLPSLPIL